MRLFNKEENYLSMQNIHHHQFYEENKDMTKCSYFRGYGEWCPEKEGVTLTWRDLSIYTPSESNSKFFTRSTPRPYKRLVNSVSGAVRPGSLVALMGSSGAGKSTLMNALANRNPAGIIIDGDIRVNGRPIGKYMNEICGYVPQDDLFVTDLTVREHLTFMARLRLDRRCTRAERRRQVDELLSQIGLLARADTRIGATAEDKVLSGGEKKRLAFATELLTDPSLLFCDEPTTGLDSFSAQKIVNMMNNMAKNGKTILCTIHQPSSEVFSLFHELILLVDGRVAFMGTKENALTFFESLNYKCPANYNSADFFIQTLSVTPGDEERSRVAIKAICDQYTVSEHSRAVDLLVQYERHIADSSEVPVKDKKFIYQNKLKPLWITQFLWLTYRSILCIMRDPNVQKLKVVQKMVIALMVGLCYIGTKVDQKGVQAIQGSLFVFVTENTFAPMYSVLAVFPHEMPLFMREYKSGLYGVGVYYISKIVALIPGLILEPTLFVLVAYWLIGLRSTIYAVVMTCFIIVLTINVSTACGHFFSSAFESTSLAMSYLIPFDFILMATSGLFIKLSSLPFFIGWVKYLSWLMYSTEAMSIVQWQGVRNITCDASRTDLPCLSTGAEVLHSYSFSEANLPLDIFTMLLLYVVFHLLGYLLLSSRARRQ